MRCVRSAALILGTSFALFTCCWIAAGCGNGYGDQPLVEIDSTEMQKILQETPPEPDVGDTAEQSAPSPASQNETIAKTEPNEKTTTPNDDPAASPEGELKSGIFPGDKQPRELKLLIPEKKLKTEGPDGVLRITYDDINLLKILNMDPVTGDVPQLMPQWLKDLEGKRIRLRGFMYPAFQETGLPSFVVVRDIQECCFGPNPKPYDLIRVVMREGVTTDYIQSRPFDVEGIFHIKIVQFSEDEVDGVYEIDDALVIQK